MILVTLLFKVCNLQTPPKPKALHGSENPTSTHRETIALIGQNGSAQHPRFFGPRIRQPR